MSYRWWVASGLFAGALFVVGLRYGMTIASPDRPAPAPAAASCTAPAPTSGLVVIPAGVTG